MKDGPENDYWAHVDFIVGKAEELGLHVGFLPTWGDKWNKRWGVGPEIFTEQSAAAYGKWLGTRYKDKPEPAGVAAVSVEKVKAWWFNPRDGKATPIGEFAASGVRESRSPDANEALDRVLVLDDASKNFPPPGSAPFKKR